jgi:mRNA interferase MazF
LVIAAEEVNQAFPIVTVLSVTSVKPGRKIYPTEIFLDASVTGLPKDSIAIYSLPMACTLYNTHNNGP